MLEIAIAVALLSVVSWAVALIASIFAQDKHYRETKEQLNRIEQKLNGEWVE